MKEALQDAPPYQQFASLGDGVSRLPDESSTCGSVICGKPKTW